MVHVESLLLKSVHATDLHMQKFPYAASCMHTCGATACVHVYLCAALIFSIWQLFLTHTSCYRQNNDAEHTVFSLQPQDVADCQSHSFRTKVFKETQVCRVCQDVIWNEGRSCKCKYILTDVFMWLLTIESVTYGIH